MIAERQDLVVLENEVKEKGMYEVTIVLHASNLNVHNYIYYNSQWCALYKRVFHDYNYY